jgi:hypothetical protein
MRENGVYMGVKEIPWEQVSVTYETKSENNVCHLEGAQVCWGNTVGLKPPLSEGAIGGCL